MILTGESPQKLQQDVFCLLSEEGVSQPGKQKKKRWADRYVKTGMFILVTPGTNTPTKHGLSLFVG